VYSKKVIRRKQNSTQQEWLTAWNNIEKCVSENHIKRLTRDTANRLVKDTTGKKVAYGWSGGKDSLVIEAICELVGIRKAAMFITKLEYSDFYDYVEKHKPHYLDVFYTKHDIRWLAENQARYLFPKHSKGKNQYFIEIQRGGLKRCFKDNNLDQIIVGHRTADGNHCPDFINTNKDGYTRNAPIKDWTHEEVLAFLKYFNIPLPKIYFYEEGFVHGTGPYSSMIRGNRTINQCWDYAYIHDNKSVLKASRHIESAYMYLTERGLIA